MKTLYKFADFSLYCGLWLASGLLIYFGMQSGLKFLSLPDWLCHSLSFILAFIGGIFLAESVGGFQNSKKDLAALRESLKFFSYLFATLIVFCGITLGVYLLVSPFFDEENLKSVFAFSGMFSLVGIVVSFNLICREKNESKALLPDKIEERLDI